MTTLSRRIATAARSPRWPIAAAGKACKTQMRADLGSRTPLPPTLALEKPWQGDPPAMRTWLTPLRLSRMDFKRRKLSSVKEVTEPTFPPSSGSSESTSHDGFLSAFACKRALASESVSYMMTLMPDSGPGGMPRELSVCQHPPMPVKRPRTRNLAEVFWRAACSTLGTGGALDLVDGACAAPFVGPGGWVVRPEEGGGRGGASTWAVSPPLREASGEGEMSVKTTPPPSPTS